MTELFMNVCCSSYNEEKHAIDCMMDNVDHSLIDYDKCIDEMLGLGALGMFIDSILYIVKKTSHICLNISNVVNKCCQYGSSAVMFKVLHNVDHECFEKEEFINNMNPDIDDHTGCWNKIVQLILP